MFNLGIFNKNSLRIFREISLKIIKNVSSSSTSHKKLRLNVIKSLRNYDNLKKNLPSTFIYEPILMKIYKNANIVFNGV